MVAKSFATSSTSRQDSTNAEWQGNRPVNALPTGEHPKEKKGKNMAYKRTVKHKDCVETIVYQDNGWILHIVKYDDGTVEEFYETPED